jgi:hypothetical protein
MATKEKAAETIDEKPKTPVKPKDTTISPLPLWPPQYPHRNPLFARGGSNSNN